MTHEKCIVVVELAVGEDEKELGAVRGGLKGMGQPRREVPQVAGALLHKLDGVTNPKYIFKNVLTTVPRKF